MKKRPLSYYLEGSGNAGERDSGFSADDLEHSDVSNMGAGAGAIAKPYVITIENTFPTTQTAVVFGGNDNVDALKQGNPAGIDVTTVNSSTSYLRLLRQSMTKPFTIGSWRLTSSNTSQLAQIITVQYVDANGKSQTDFIEMLKDSYQNLDTQLDIYYSIEITGDTILNIPILGLSSLTIYMYPESISNPARALEKKSAPMGVRFSNPKLSGKNVPIININTKAA